MRFAHTAVLLWCAASAALAFTTPAASGQAAASPSGASNVSGALEPAVAEPHFPTNEDLRHLRALSAPLLSPDGNLVLFTVGYSYGGEMAGFAEGKTDRFKAIVSGAPVIDQFSEYGTEHGSWYDRWYYGKPWEHVEDAWRQSPLSGAAHAKTPFLLLQGVSDATDPLGQAEEMYRALRQEGVPVELVTYPREDHGPLATGIFGRPSQEPWHGFDARQRIVEFIEKGFGSSAAKP